MKEKAAGLIIGAHMSISDGYTAMVRDAISIGANAIQYFTRNPRGYGVRALDEDDIKNAFNLLSENGIPCSHIIAHAPYTMNPCSAKEDVRRFTIDIMREDIERLEHFPGTLYNFHPGSHTGQGVDVGIKQTALCLASIMTAEQKTVVLIETMAGKGTEIGHSFEEIRDIIDVAEAENTSVKGKIGVCLDTCHINDAGYDVINDLDGILERFDLVIGLKRLRAVHLNDSKNPFGSHKDRHEIIGNGEIGIQAIERVINHPHLRSLPFCLETPNDLAGYAAEIALLRTLYKN